MWERQRHSRLIAQMRANSQVNLNTRLMDNQAQANPIQKLSILKYENLQHNY